VPKVEIENQALATWTAWHERSERASLNERWRVDAMKWVLVRLERDELRSCVLDEMQIRNVAFDLDTADGPLGLSSDDPRRWLAEDLKFACDHRLPIRLARVCSCRRGAGIVKPLRIWLAEHKAGAAPKGSLVVDLLFFDSEGVRHVIGMSVSP
jgi:hypothetical protein